MRGRSAGVAAFEDWAETREVFGVEGNSVGESVDERGGIKTSEGGVREGAA